MELRNKNLPDSQKDRKGVLQYQFFLYIPVIICSKVINCHHDNSLLGHFIMNKTRKMIIKKFFWPSSIKTSKPI